MVSQPAMMAFLLPLAPIDVAACLLAEAMRLVNQRLHYGQRIGDLVLVLARGSERVPSRGVQLDPIRTVSDLLAHGRARFLHRANHRAG